MNKVFKLFLFSFLIIPLVKADLLKVIEVESYISENIEYQLSHFLKKEDFFVQVRVTAEEPSFGKNEVPKKKNKVDFKLTPLAKFGLPFEPIEELDAKPTQPLQAEPLKLKDIKVSVFFSDQLDQPKIEEAKNIISKNFSKFGNIEVQYDFQTIQKDVPVVKKKKFFEKYPLETVLGGSMIIFLLFLMFSVMKFLGFGKSLVEALKSSGGATNMSSNSESLNTGGEISSEAMPSDVETGDRSSVTSISKDLVVEKEGLSAFKELIVNEPKKASNQIRIWNRENSSISNNAIAYSIKSLDMQTLEKFLLEFTPSEKKEVLRSVKQPIKHEVVSIDNFILSKMIEDLMNPSLIDDPELQTKVVSTEIDQLVEVATVNPELGAELMAILPKSLVDQICTLIDPDIFAKVMSFSMDFSHEKLRNNFSNLKLALESSHEAELKELSPVFDKMVSFLKTATRQKEEIIFDVLVKAKSRSEFREIAYQNFPRELFSQIPAPLFKGFFAKITMSHKVEFLAIQPENKRNEFLNLIAEPGHKMRDMLDMELRKVLDNPTVLDNINRNKTSIETRLNGQLRTFLMNIDYQDKVMAVLNPWVESKYANAEKIQMAS